MKYKPSPAKIRRFPAIDAIIRHIPKNPRFWLLLSLIMFIAGWILDSFVTFIIYIVDPTFFFENELNPEILALASSGTFPFWYFIANLSVILFGFTIYWSYKIYDFDLVILLSAIVCFLFGTAHMMVAFNWIFKYISFP